MTPKWVVARVTALVNKTSTAGMPIVAVRLHLLQSIAFKHKRVRTLDTTFSLQPRALRRLSQFLDAVEYPHKNGSVVTSFPRLHGRYCRVAVQPEFTNYQERMIEHLVIKNFATVNQPVHMSPIDRANDALAELNLPAHIDTEGQLIIASPKSEESRCDDDED